MTCGYKSDGDSSGLVFFGKNEYDRKGRRTLEIYLREPEGNYSYRPSPSAASDYFKFRQKNGRIMDTIWSGYNDSAHTEFDEFRTNDGEKKPWKLIYVSDANGNRIRQESYSGESSLISFINYDAKGHLINEYRSENGDSAELYMNCINDSLGRPIREYTYGKYADSTLYSYTTTQRIRTWYWAKNSYFQWRSDLNDSIITDVGYEIKKDSVYGQIIARTDSSFIERDKDGNILSRYKERNFYSLSTERTYDKFNRNHITESIVISGKDTTKIEKWSYDTQQHLKNYKMYKRKELVWEIVYTVNEKGDVETINEFYKNKLVQRDVFEYEYY
jgi:hypothetical protein